MKKLIIISLLTAYFTPTSYASDDDSDSCTSSANADIDNLASSHSSSSGRTPTPLNYDAEFHSANQLTHQEFPVVDQIANPFQGLSINLDLINKFSDSPIDGCNPNTPLDNDIVDQTLQRSLSREFNHLQRQLFLLQTKERVEQKTFHRLCSRLSTFLKTNSAEISKNSLLTDKPFQRSDASTTSSFYCNNFIINLKTLAQRHQFDGSGIPKPLSVQTESLDDLSLLDIKQVQSVEELDLMNAFDDQKEYQPRYHDLSILHRTFPIRHRRSSTTLDGSQNDISNGDILESTLKSDKAIRYASTLAVALRARRVLTPLPLQAKIAQPNPINPNDL